MILRPRQRAFVERCTAALDTHGNTVGIAATGFGKTIALSALAGHYLKKKAKVLILQHRDELLSQNRSKLLKVVPNVRATVFNADFKNWSGDVVFASEPTLRRESNLQKMPAFDLSIVDEAHHIAAPGYQRIVEALRDRKPGALLFGTTATIARGDKASLKPTFTNIADVVGIRELVASGHLVRPRVFAIDLGLQEELRDVRKVAGEYDQERVGEIFNRPVVTDAVIKHWRERAGDRKTVVFCSTIAHAEDVACAFNQAGFSASCVHGELTIEDRRRRLKAFEEGRTQVLTNVAVLTEGWDHQPVSCVIYLRMSSYKSTFIQAVGRALRTVDPDLFPGVVKKDAIILDFGATARLIGSLELDDNLADDRPSEGVAATKVCPDCSEVVALNAKTCECGHEFATGLEAEFEEAEPISDFIMSEIDLLARSSFRWVDLFGDDGALMATGFKAWAGCFLWDGAWHAVGGVGGEGIKRETRYLGPGTRTVAMALADDWMNTHESDDSARKTKRWLDAPASEKQLAILGEEPNPFGCGLSKYAAACRITFQFNKRHIQRLVLGHRAVGWPDDLRRPEFRKKVA